MCTIIKVKRKITDDPVDCLILECKKKRIFIDQANDLITTPKPSSSPSSATAAAAAASASTDDVTTLKSAESNSFVFNENRIDSIKQILKYAGSAKSEKEISAKLIEISSRYRSFNHGSKKDLRASNSLSSSNKDLSQLNKTNETKKEIKSNRYVLLNKKRGIESQSSIVAQRRTAKANSNLDNVNIIDVISSEYIANEPSDAVTSTPAVTKNERLTCNGVEMIREKCDINSTPAKKTRDTAVNQIEFDSKTNEYVYDIYYTKNMDIHLDLLYPNNFEIKSASLDDRIELLDDNYVDDPEDHFEDDEDSNDEGNWRNDYPDEDEDDDIDNEEDDDVYKARNVYGKHDNYDDYEDNYNEYGYGNDDDEDNEMGNRLTRLTLKSSNADRSFYEDESENEEDDDYDEYDNETSKSYSAYKRKLIRDLEK